MPSLRHLLETQAPLLLLDAASQRIQAGLLRSPDPSSWQWSEGDEEAGISLFTCLEALGFNPCSARSFAFCEGPGSILGIRSVAAALRAWQVLSPLPCWSYRSLDLVLHSLPEDKATVIADARRDSWHTATRGQPMRRTPSADLHALGPLFTPAGFRQWSKLPGQLEVRAASYSLRELLPRLLDVQDLFHAAEAPDAFLHEEPSYATWSPQIHRAPTPPPGPGPAP